MRSETWAGIIVGVAALLLGAGTLGVAVWTRRRRGELGPSYASSGGMVYTVAQVGCGGTLALLGVAMMILALVTNR